MSKQRWKLLLCAIAAAATLVTALFVSAWFHMDVMGSEMEIDLRSASMCGANGVCVAVPLSKFRGFYSIMGNAAFFAAIPVLILVVVQCASRLVTGAASSAVTKAGYGLGMVALITGFGAGYLFAPQSAGIDDIAVITVTRTWAPLIFVVGNLLALFAMYLASSEWLDDDVGEYKPIKLDGGRLPVTPLSVNRIHTPQGSQPLQRIPTPQGSQPLQRPGSDGGRSRTPTGQQRAGSEGGRSRTPTGQHAVSESGRSRTPTGQQRAMTESGRSRTPTGQQLSEDVARRLTPSEPIVRIADPSRRLTPSQQTQRVDDPARRFTPSQQIQRVDDPTRRLTPSQQTQRLDDPTRRLTPSGQIPRIDDPSRPKSPSQPPAIARTSSPSGLRSRTPSQQPLGIVEVDARAKSPSQQPVLARTTSPSGIAIDPASRARTSSSGPIDLAARLSATAPQGVLEPLGGSAGDAPIEFSIRPPLPQPEPVPPDQIPVDPAAGLTIRKRPASVAPPPLAPPLAAAPAIAASPHDEVPLSKAKTVDLPDSAFQPPIAIETPPESGLLIRKKSPTGAPHAPLSASMPAIALDGIEGLAELKDELSKPHAASPASPASPASSIEEALIANADAT
ncbi:MAG TPA: hypothetical protein VMZ53_32380, partial [Kofleriaceae bacterium]|nr:hypothetical protein [Kofleriaceae bacterium]